MSRIDVVQHQYGPDSGPLPPLPRGVDLVFADPPYNQGVAYADDASSDRLTDGEYRNLTRNAVVALARVCRPGATFWWMTPERHGDWTGQLLSEHVGPRVHRVIWHEAFAQYMGDRKLTEDFRFIFCHRVDDGDVTFNPAEIKVESVRQRMGDKRAAAGGRVPGCVWNIRRLQGTSTAHVDWHPTQLPPELLERIVKGWTNPGDLVVDGFAGSGSMGRVCRTLGRDCVLIDKSRTYVNKLTTDFKCTE